MADRHGPYRRMRFLLEIDDVPKAGFTRCHVPESRSTVVEYREGNDPPTRRKLWGLNEYGPIILENGVTDDSTTLTEWREQVERGNLEEARGNVAVVLIDETGEFGPRWEFTNAWPAEYDGPNLDANRDGAAIERLEIVHEGMRRYVPDGGRVSTHVQESAVELAGAARDPSSGGDVQNGNDSLRKPPESGEPVHPRKRKPIPDPTRKHDRDPRESDDTEREESERHE